ncbi:hypothetical protein CHS0354_020690 [Potamilus streckersoni]|uniref:Uncharacterized protein n=1 Tax=Potamilus streckersoni TaxID=2493646 RepID=A0AAE0TEQ0_9BIVA|nr:hypothetical protein CHS0354_020690 [Potamilus streckersoni]
MNIIVTSAQYPYNIFPTSLSDTEVAVTIPDNNTIQIIGITDKMLKVRDIRTRLQCRGIIVEKDQLVISANDNEHSILILDKHGKEIRTVRPKNYQTDRFFSPPLCQT